jgi:Spx/MgsR family transcriptional regulator
MIKIYSYSKCSTCRNAVKFLEKKKLDFKVIDIVENPPSKADLKKMLKFKGGELKRLFNTSGLVYKELGLKDKLDKLSKDEALSLLTENGKLVKRPFLLSDDLGLTGFKEKEWQENL